MTSPVIANSADIDPTAAIGHDTRIWHLAQIRERAVIGEGCVIGRGAYIGVGVRIGSGCKVQNNALVYEPAFLEDGVFVGPAAVQTNDNRPRAVNPDLSPKSTPDGDPVGVTIREGASIGAGAVCVAPVTVGRWAMVAAGSVVTRDVRDYALVVGVPSRQVGWVGRSGQRLVPDGDGRWRCPISHQPFVEANGALLEADAFR